MRVVSLLYYAFTDETDGETWHPVVPSEEVSTGRTFLLTVAFSSYMLT
ncbi:MAG: hypothetical protein AAGU27_24755 [Dehalobacterium sp.]